MIGQTNKYKFTEDYTTWQNHVWENFVFPYFSEFPEILEVGTYEGRTALWLLDTLREGDIAPSITCIDSWEGIPKQERLFDKNTKNKTGISKLRGMSGKKLSALIALNVSYDCVYIDGDHHAPTVLSDLVMSWQLLKSGGIMMMDDYEWDDDGRIKKPHDRPKLAIDAFLSCYEGQYIILHKEYRVVIKKL
tara:strand:+ start:16123 stop:16695 length:573 start_codon:yes stop_codon:yes gene_type:complete